MSLLLLPLHVGDFLQDIGPMNNDQIVAFVLLKLASCSQEPTGTLPNDNAVLARLARVSEKDFLALKPFALRGWTRQGKRLVNEAICKSHARVLAASKRGQYANDVRWGKQGSKHPNGLASESESECEEKKEREEQTASRCSAESALLNNGIPEEPTKKEPESTNRWSTNGTGQAATEKRDAASSPNANNGDGGIPTPKTKRDHAAPLRKTTYNPLGPWFNDLCGMWPNRGRADRNRAEPIARTLEADGPRILAAAKELAKTDQWMKDGGAYVEKLSSFLTGGTWLEVPVILDLGDAQRELDRALTGIGEHHYKYRDTQRLRTRFTEACDAKDLPKCGDLVEAARKLQKERLPL